MTKSSGKTLEDTSSLINVNDKEIEMFARLSRQGVLALSPEMKMKYLFALQVRHRNLEEIGKDVMTLLQPFNETSILFIIGATGVGKTTLSKRVIKALVNSSDNKDLSALPFIFIAAAANGERSLSWRSIYRSVLRAAREILIDQKQATLVCNGIMTVKPTKYKDLTALRDALESTLRNRKVRVLAIDEAYHLLRFGNFSAVMDTLKSIVDVTGVKLLLLGSYDLYELATDYGQVSRRAEILHFKRYDKDSEGDLVEFGSIVNKIQLNWPCEDIPPFNVIVKELMQASLGCVGLLKALMLRALDMQLQKGGIWNPRFLMYAAKSIKLLTKMREEIEAGEEKLMGGAYGESIFTGDILNDVTERMANAKIA